MGGTVDFVLGAAFPGFRKKPGQTVSQRLCSHHSLECSSSVSVLRGFPINEFDSGRGIVPRPQKMVLPAGSGIFCSFGLFCLKNKLYFGKQKRFLSSEL